MLTYLIVATLAQASTVQAPIRMCPGEGRCPNLLSTPESPEIVSARRERFMALQALVYGPLATGRSPSACALATKRAADAQHPGMAAIIQILCRN